MYGRSVIISITLCVVSPLAISQPPPAVPDTGYALVDSLAYSEKLAPKIWQPMAGGKEVSLIEIGGAKVLRMPCNFKDAKIERASWDRQMRLDLAMCKGVRFLFYCADASPVSHFSFYFRSGQGWYAGSFDAPASTGWGAITIDKSTMRAEGQPSGWGDIDTIRISAWRGQNKDTEFYITALGLYGANAKIVIARGDSDPAEAKAAAQYADIAADFLHRAGLPYILASERDIRAGRLKAAKLVILPYNPKMPDEAAKALASFLRGGGKLIACYTLPDFLEEIVGIRKGPHVRQ